MLSDRDKKEMLADGLSRKRRDEFLLAERQKPKGSQTLNDYLAFLMAAQKIRPFKRQRTITPMGKNIL